MKNSLYNITTNYNDLMTEIEAAEGVLTDEQITALEITEKELQSKSIAYLEVIKGKEAFNSQIDEEIKRLTAMKKTNNNIAARLKENLLNAVKMFGGFEAGLNKFGTRKSQSIIVDETANKTELKAAIKRGETIKGVQLVDNLNLKIN